MKIPILSVNPVLDSLNWYTPGISKVKENGTNVLPTLVEVRSGRIM